MSEKQITLTENSESIKYLCAKDKRLAKAISMIGSISYQLHNNSYDFLVETIIGQMLSNKVADVLCSRLHLLCDNEITPENISALSDEQIKSIGTASAKVTYIRALSKRQIKIVFK